MELAETAPRTPCPTCAGPVPAGARTCPRCAAAVAPATADGQAAPSPVCPRCSRPVRPGERYVTLLGASEHGSCPHCGAAMAPAASAPPHRAFEEKAERCWPTDLERIARREAADGWALVDSTIDPTAHGRILAHFRRPARGDARAVAGSAPRRPDAATAAPPLEPAPAARHRSRRRRGPAIARFSTRSHSGPAWVFGLWSSTRPHRLARVAARPVRARWSPGMGGGRSGAAVRLARLVLSVGLYAGLFAVLMALQVAFVAALFACALALFVCGRVLVGIGRGLACAAGCGRGRRRRATITLHAR